MSIKPSTLLLIFVLTAFSNAAFIEPNTRTPLRPFSINQGYTTDYNLYVTIPTAIPMNAVIEVEFPILYQIPSACSAYIKIGTGSFSTYPCQKPSHSRYIVSVGEIISGDYQIVFEGIVNPVLYSASSNFKIRTYVNDNVMVDANEYLDAVPFLDAPCKLF